MKMNVVPSLADPVGGLWRELQALHHNKPFYVAAPLSSTPLPVYRWVVERAQAFGSWENVKFVLMDEQAEQDGSGYKYIAMDDPASYEGFANKHFLEPLRGATGVQLEVVKPPLDDIDSFDTPLDLLILALGVRGNYANVMPDTTESTGWHIANLLPDYKQAHTDADSASYAGATFRDYGMSLGPQQVLKAKRVVVIVSGEKKRTLVKELFSYKKFDPVFPLSIIFHPEITDRVEVFVTDDLAESVGNF